MNCARAGCSIILFPMIMIIAARLKLGDSQLDYHGRPAAFEADKQVAVRYRCSSLAKTFSFWPFAKSHFLRRFVFLSF